MVEIRLLKELAQYSHALCIVPVRACGLLERDPNTPWQQRLFSHFLDHADLKARCPCELRDPSRTDGGLQPAAPIIAPVDACRHR